MIFARQLGAHSAQRRIPAGRAHGSGDPCRGFPAHSDAKREHTIPLSIYLHILLFFFSVSLQVWLHPLRRDSELRTDALFFQLMPNYLAGLYTTLRADGSATASTLVGGKSSTIIGESQICRTKWPPSVPFCFSAIPGVRRRRL